MSPALNWIMHEIHSTRDNRRLVSDSFFLWTRLWSVQKCHVNLVGWELNLCDLIRHIKLYAVGEVDYANVKGFIFLSIYKILPSAPGPISGRPFFRLQKKILRENLRRNVCVMKFETWVCICCFVVSEQLYKMKCSHFQLFPLLYIYSKWNDVEKLSYNHDETKSSYWSELI